MDSKIRTRILIISDTHGLDFDSSSRPLQEADVAIHCGDLTDGSKLEEFRTAIKLLREIQAPLKLVIAGNHDFTMDLPAFERKVAEATSSLDPELVAREYGIPGEARQLFEEAKDAGIEFLDEGNHRFTLRNGASLIVYASPRTPALGAWGFQYHPEGGRDFQITSDIDVAITHGPPKGIMDRTCGGERAGCQSLFAAIAQAKPRLHCFGHIHEGWGARLVTWRKFFGKQPTHFTAIDNDKSITLEKLTGLEATKFDTEEDIKKKLETLRRYRQERCCTTTHCAEDQHLLEKDKQTLFVNASVCDSSGLLVQIPWLVELDLPSATEKDSEGSKAYKAV